jgi:hypothetical protein
MEPNLGIPCPSNPPPPPDRQQSPSRNLKEEKARETNIFERKVDYYIDIGYLTWVLLAVAESW